MSDEQNLVSDLAEISADLAAWDGEVVKAMVAGFLAIAIKQHKQLKAKK